MVKLDKKKFLIHVLIAAFAFLFVLVILELFLGYSINKQVSYTIESKRKNEFIFSWNQFLFEQKKLHKSKVTGFAWWVEVANAVNKKNYKYILFKSYDKTKGFSSENTLINNYDWYVIMGNDNDFVYAVRDKKTTVNNPKLTEQIRDIELENKFGNFMKSRFERVKKQALIAAKNKTLTQPFVFHFITQSKGQVYFVSLSYICNDSGVPHSPSAYMLFANKIDKLVKNAEKLIPAHLAFSKEKPKNSSFFIKIKGFVKNESYYLSFEPKVKIAKIANNSLKSFIGVQIILTILLFIITVPILLSKSTKKLRDVIDEQTTLLKNANKQLNYRHQQVLKELALAKKIQQSILPKIENKKSNFKIEGRYLPMDDLGGDFYDVIELEKDLIALLISDVSGHGVSAALVTAMIKMAFHITPKEMLKKPDAFLAYLNEQLLGKINNNFVTAFYMLIGLKELKVIYCNAGHVAPVLVNEAGQKMLSTRGKPLAVLKDGNYQVKEEKILKNSKIIFYTDGLTETINKEGQMFGEQAFSKTLEANSLLSIENLLDVILYELARFKGDRNFEDDVALLSTHII